MTTAPVQTKTMLDRARRHLKSERQRVNGMSRPRGAVGQATAETMIEAMSTRHLVMYGPDPVAITVEAADAYTHAEKQARRTFAQQRIYWTDTGKLMADLGEHARFTGYRVAKVRAPEGGS